MFLNVALKYVTSILLLPKLSLIGEPLYQLYIGSRNNGSGSKCSGLIKPDTFLGGNITTIKEVFNDKHTTIVYNRL